MGKHKEKSTKHKKHKNKKKKSKKRYSSSSEEEWVEKKIEKSSSEEDQPNLSNKKCKPDEHSESTSNEDSEKNHSRSEAGRDDWMNLQASCFTSSNFDRRRERDELKKVEREKQQYDPRQCSRELNPYWKDGGDGLPKFKKPNLDADDSYTREKVYGSRVPNWRKRKNVEESVVPGSSRNNTVVHKEQSVSSTGNSNDSILTEKELNTLAAKLVKAEIMGNTKLVAELQEKLEKARSMRKTKFAEEECEVLLTHTDSQGRSQPLKSKSEYGESSGHHKRKKNIETHKDGQRVRYFADDDKYSLKQMFEREKYNSSEDQNSEFLKMASKIRKNDDLDDIFSDNIRKKESDLKTDSKNTERAINEHQKMTKSLDNCDKCIQSGNMLKHLMVTMKEYSYLGVPPYEPLTEGHCLIIPIRHTPCSTQLDENEWSEILDIRKALVRFFESKNEEAIFFETAVSLHRYPHMYIECIPMPKEDGAMAPIYFKKAIDESETEWAHNKKLISLKGRDVRKAIPKGLPYFWVSFGMEEGYAHVIEDEKMFPRNFAQEIIGGMLDAHHSKWRKPKRQSFDEQSKRVVTFSKDWGRFDVT